ncbi:uncharacterized protein PRCAT00001216001 [Priceomyces carsonii]|uniref:uncharacterized protein n=1 Tax=Priceomyces carsonii TaxID=28549 RepID=UPI002EDA31E7|nr:unnamed protein product [Priceomyces carsonii]
MIGTESYYIVIEVPDITDTSSESDYRLSSVEVTAIDFKVATTPSENMLKSDALSIEPLKARLTGNSIIRLYREFERIEGIEGLSISEGNKNDLSKDEYSIIADDTMVSIVAVPTYFTATDLLGFIGESNMKHITHIRILKSNVPNRFLVLIKFDNAFSASEFQYNFNGKPFNSMEPETCHVVFIKALTLDSPLPENDSNDEGRNLLIPFLLQDPFTPGSVSKTINSLSSDGTLIELPTCPVCLEKMDATITGLLTIPCQHTFHCQCLSKWKDDTCPICRYSNNISNQRLRKSFRLLLQSKSLRRQHFSSSGSSSNNQSSAQVNGSEGDVFERCIECESDSNLWICLICGNVGCGRYAPEQHSLKHFINTGHCFAMELATSRVWDYAGDNYVHRLVTNESDGKIVELPEKNMGLGSSDDGVKPLNANADKVDQVGFEYSQLLISQLASQREYYESLLLEREAPKSRRPSSINDVWSSSDLQAKVEELSRGLGDLNVNVIPSLKKKIAVKDEKINVLMKDLSVANSLNDAFSSKIDYLTKINDGLKQQMKDLNDEKTGLSEQVTDLMFFLDSQEKFKNEPDEVKDGKVVVQQGSSSSARKLKNKKKK